MRAFLAVFITLCMFGLGAVGENRARSPIAITDPISDTMTTMRLAGAFLDDIARQAGTYPSADGKLRRLGEVVRGRPLLGGAAVAVVDAWKRPLLYQATSRNYRLISLGADGLAESDVAARPIVSAQLAEIVDANEAHDDLVMVTGRFIMRPFGESKAAFTTINAMTRVAIAMMEYSIDNNRYPDAPTGFTPLSGVAAELVPVYLAELPTLDGWGQPLLYFTNGTTFGLASYGADHALDRTYYPDLAGGIPWNDEGPSASSGADVVFANGQFVHWPTKVEP